MTNAFTRTALWGNLLHDPDIAQEFSPAVFVGRMLQFERAWTEALKTTGTVDQDAADRVLQAMDVFKPDADALGKASEVDGLPVPELVRQLMSGLPKTAQAAIHTGATSQDVIDTSMILTACSILTVFEQRGKALLECLDTLAARSADNPIMGRTRMQAALPITAGDRIEDWRTPLAAHIDQLPVLINRISIVQVGGAVGLRTTPGRSIEKIAACVAESLNLSVCPVWHTDRSVMLDIGHWLTKISGTLGKIGQDIALMAQQGIDEITLDGAGGSSAMPHKQNPVRAEILVASARVVAGHQGILSQSMIHEQERSGAAWAIEWMTLPAMFEATGASLNNADHLLGQIRQFGTGTRLQSKPMTVEEWEINATPRTELLHGFEYDLRCQSTTTTHTEVCFNLYKALDAAIGHHGDRSCTPRGEGPLVRVNDHLSHIPDVTVECHREANLPNTHIKPCIVVEVLSERTRYYDTTTKLTSYMQFLDYITDYLVVDPEKRTVIRHRKLENHDIVIDQFANDDTVQLHALDPISISLGDVFAGLEDVTILE